MAPGDGPRLRAALGDFAFNGASVANGRKQGWRNRIVEYADVEPSQLLAHENNFRRHPGPQQDALTGIIGELGFLDPVLVQAGSDKVIDGHLRVELAMRTGQSTIPVQYVDLTDDEVNLALASFDPISAMAYHDAEQLRELLDAVSTSDAAVMAMLSQLAEDAGIVPPDVEFKEYDESVEGTVEYCECPECGHRFPK